MAEALARAARQVSLYGRGHPVSVTAAARAVEILDSHASGETVEIAVEEDDLLWNGVPLPASHPHVSWLRESMRDRLIASISLLPPVQPEEAARLLDVLAEDPQALAESGGAMKVFSRRPSSGVSIQDVDFAQRLRESEAAWLDYCQQVAPEASDSLARVVESCLDVHRWSDAPPPPMMLPAGADPSYGEDRSSRELLAEGLARFVQRTGENTHFPDEEARRTWRLKLLESLRALPPEWRAHVFRSPSGASPGFPDMLTLIARELSAEECASLVLDYPGAIAEERSGGLRRLLNRIISDPERAETIAPALHQAAREAGIEEQLYQNVVGVLLMEVRQGGSDGLTAEPAHRAPASDGEDRDEFSDLIPSQDDDGRRRARAHLLMDLSGCDLRGVQRAIVFPALGKQVEQCVKDGDAELALEGVRVLFRLTQDDDEETRAAAERAMARLDAPPVAQALREEAERGSGEGRAEAIALLGCLGKSGLEALCALALEPDPELAAEAARALAARDAPGYEHLEKLLMSLSPEGAGAVVPAILFGKEDRARERLHALARHPDPQVRSDAVWLLRDCRWEGTTEILIKFARDEELEVRLPAIRALGERRAAGAVPALCSLIRGPTAQGEPMVVREAAMAALGKIGSPRAVSALAEALAGGGLLGRLRSPALRVAAARALGAIGSPEAREALNRFTRSRQRVVREACREALSPLEAGAGPAGSADEGVGG